MMPLVQLDFEVRKDYIYKTFCINRDKPITVCGGQCYLNDRIKSLTQQQERNTETQLEVQSFPFFKEEIQKFSLATSILEINSIVSIPYAFGLVIGYPTNIFRPPRLV